MSFMDIAIFWSRWKILTNKSAQNHQFKSNRLISKMGENYRECGENNPICTLIVKGVSHQIVDLISLQSSFVNGAP